MSDREVSRIINGFTNEEENNQIGYYGNIIQKQEYDIVSYLQNKIEITDSFVER